MSEIKVGSKVKLKERAQIVHIDGRYGSQVGDIVVVAPSGAAPGYVGFIDEVWEVKAVSSAPKQYFDPTTTVKLHSDRRGYPKTITARIQDCELDPAEALVEAVRARDAAAAALTKAIGDKGVAALKYHQCSLEVQRLRGW